MPYIRFLKNHTPIEVPKGAPLMKSLLQAGLPVASSCGGDGICTKCQVVVIAHPEHLSPPGPLETEQSARHNLPADVRLSCQTAVLADVVIDTSYW